VPFRLLGLAQDPTQAAELSGHTFTYYRRCGVELQVVTLDARRVETGGGASQAIAALRPQVVVAHGAEPAFADAVRSAFLQARELREAGPVPLKLYFAVPPPLTPLVTTMVTTPGRRQPDLFVRVYPAPWLSGILERDLFAGVPGEGAGAQTERIAS
jgi:hypothetical protein